jgi:Protein of unknown function (DUF1572)
MEESITRHYLADAISSFRAYKGLAEKALAQVNDEELFITLDEEGNSLAVIMKHIAGNMISRWTDFLTTDGEKPERNRDMEFVIEPGMTRDQVMAYWERGWREVFAALEPLSPEDFKKKVTIRGQEHTIVEAINRQMTHYAYHIGQIVFLAKHFRSSEWNSLSIPRNRSQDFNKYLENKGETKEHRMDAAAGFSESESTRRNK